MALTADEIAARFPIHWLVWNNQHEELKNSLEAKKFNPEEIECKDPRGRTPLLLAVTLGYVEAVRALIDAGADVNCEKDGWTAVQEATATGDQELLSLVLARRDYQRHVLRAGGIPDLLRRLSLAPDFYVEMKWEFTSWVPLVSRMCPFDTYKVYKRGGNVRVDTTLVGFENNRWERGDRTYIFQGNGGSASLVELDHLAGTVWREALEASPRPPPDRLLARRLRTPIAINYLDTDKICFERNKSGIWGWRQDKTESVNGYECKVFSANNVELVSKTRTEHLPRGERPAPRAPLAGLLALADRDLAPAPSPSPASPATPAASPAREDPPPIYKSREDLSTVPVTWEEYFGENPLERDIGRPKVIDTKVQKFKATLWLCEDYPLELREQIMPILDLMASISSPHFAKLKDFVQMQLPAGFPVKIEIPLFHVLNARITFGNIFGTEAGVRHIECIAEGARPACVVDDACFLLGAAYRHAAAPPAPYEPYDDTVLQYALLHDEQVDVWEALRGAPPSSPAPPPVLLANEDRLLQRAIEESLAAMALGGGAPPALAPGDEGEGEDVERERGDGEIGEEGELDAELRRALELSACEHRRYLDERLADEQREIDEALRLSLLDQ